ncbi:MAG TPA: MerR family transcriptional regulator [Propionicimonas sp.]|nr:MerR family transcriptional regulator [Propionicimonas sp.]
MVTIKEAAALTGVSEYTLRAWEDRYGVIAPQRTPSGYRIYSDADLDQVKTMASLITAGLAPRAAAAETARRHQLGSVEDPFAELIAAAATLDARRLSAELGRRFTSYDFEVLVRLWLMPAMKRLGEEWREGNLGVASEHLVAAQVMRRLSAAYDQATPKPAAVQILIGAPPGVDHQLGIFAFAVACRRLGLNTTYLGGQLPTSAWSDAAERARPDAIVTTIPRLRDAPKVALLAAQLRSTGIPLWVGGRHQQSATEPARQLGHDIPDAAVQLDRATRIAASASEKTRL